MRNILFLIFLGFCCGCHKLESEKTLPIAPITPAPPAPTPALDLNKQLNLLSASDEGDNQQFVQLLCEHLAELPDAQAPYELVMKILLNKLDLAVLLPEKDCAYVAQTIFEQTASEGILQIDAADTSSDGQPNPLSKLVKELNADSDFRILKHLKRFFRSVTIFGDQDPLASTPEVNDDDFISAFFNGAGEFCKVDLSFVSINKPIYVNIDDDDACSPLVTLRFVQFQSKTRIDFKTKRPILSARIQIRGVSSTSRLEELVDAGPATQLNLFSYAPDIGQKLFELDQLNPYLFSDLTGWEKLSSLSSKIMRNTDKPYLNFADTAVSDLTPLADSISANFNAYFQNNLDSILKSSVDRKKDCNALVRFRAVAFVPTWYTQQNYDVLSEEQKSIFRSISGTYREACKAVRDRSMLDPINLQKMNDTCAADGLTMNDFKAFACDLPGVTI